MVCRIAPFLSRLLPKSIVKKQAPGTPTYLNSDPKRQLVEPLF